MSDLVERVRDVLPSVRSDLEDLVRIESVGADPTRQGEVQRSAEAVAKLLSQAGFGDVRIVSEDGAPAVIARHPAPSGSRRRSSRPNATAASMAAAAPTTRPVSQRISPRSVPTVASRRSG